MDIAAECGLKSMVNTIPVGKNPSEHRQRLHKITLNLKLTLVASSARSSCVLNCALNCDAKLNILEYSINVNCE